MSARDVALTSPWSRLHAALMPDYNPRATAYWWTAVLLGGLALAYAVACVAQVSAAVEVQILVGSVLAIVAGFFPVRIPRSKNSFVAGEVFIFLLLMMHGAPAATIAAAGEAFVGAYRSSKRWTSRIASPAMSAFAMLVSATMFEAVSALLRARGLWNPGTQIIFAMFTAVVYFAINTVLVSMVIILKRNERFSLENHLEAFGSIGVAYAGSASMAALLAIAVQTTGISVLFGALPVVALLLTTVHYILRKQEADEAVRKSQSEAAEREAAQMARHVEQLKASEQRFHSAFTHASIGMALLSFDGRILQANAALVALLGERRADTLVEHRFADLVVEADRDLLTGELEQVHSGAAETFTIEVRCRHRSDNEIWAALHCGLFSEVGSDRPCLILQVQDVSARRHAEAQLNRIAFHDGLTGLPNRGRFHALLGQALENARADATKHFAVMFLDFDRFKLINDSMGHSAGDEFLIQVSRRIQDHVRPGDVVARLGGDEFAVLVHHLESESAATHLAERLQDVLRQPLSVAGVHVTTSASIGITFSHLGYDTTEAILRDADIAMYRAKAAGKARYALFDADQHTQVSERVRLEADLRSAIARREIGVAYQPLFSLASGALRGFEALARWEHPQLGPISPATFIPIAEESGLIIELTDLVLESACSRLRQWQSRAPSLAELRMHVNISGPDLAQPQLAARVEQALRVARLEARHLMIELTENIVMQRVEGALDTLAALRKLGVAIAIDDFGTGYSSLAYLSRLPIDCLKIDRSFVAGMTGTSGESHHSAEIVRAIVSLGGTLGKSVVAEGIETDSQLGQLRDLGCRGGQGYHLSRPLNVAEVELLLDCVLADTLTGGAVSSQYGVMPVVRH
jgi:diguanylate cyclase (GGDEF)-like protein/PAS domain S-box-containing protein